MRRMRRAAAKFAWCRQEFGFRIGQQSAESWMLSTAFRRDRPGPSQPTSLRSTRYRLLRRGFHPFHRAGAVWFLSRSKISASNWYRPGDRCKPHHHQRPIDDTGVIEGQFGEQEANDLGWYASGALPPPSSISKNELVGPSRARIDPSRSAGLDRRLLVVMVFMVVYYRLSGVTAIVALI